MWPAGIEPATRRVSGDRSTGLSYGHEGSGRGWDRTSNLSFVRRALSLIALLAHELRDKDLNLDLRVQGAVSSPVRRSRSDLLVEERDVTHRTRALLGVHLDAVPRVQHDRRVVG